MTRSAPAPKPSMETVMFNPYGYPPMWGYPPQQPPMMPMTPDIEARAYKIALKLRKKEENKKIKEDAAKEKKKHDDRKKIEDSRRKNLFGIEWYVLGLLSYPFMAPLYKAATHNLAVFGGQ